MDNLCSHEHNAITSFCLLTSVNQLHFQHPQHYDLCKAPELYHEALAQPDADVWHAAM